MTWVRIPDNWWRDPAVLSLSSDAQALFVRLLAYSADQRTDGRLPRVVVGTVAPASDELVRELVAGGFLAAVADGLQVPAPERFLFTEARRAAKVAAADARWHAPAHASASAPAHADGNAVHTGTGTGIPVPTPVPGPGRANGAETPTGAKYDREAYEAEVAARLARLLGSAA